MAKSESICNPCFRGDIESEGFSFCSDCEEILCLNCDKAHRVGKLTLNHHITEIEQLPKVPEETIKSLRLCEKHHDNYIELYCNFHDILCCKTCMVEDHRTCDKLDVIDDISGNIKSSALVEDISMAILSLLQTYDTVIENRSKIKDSICQSETKVKEAIAKLKEHLIRSVESLEKSLLSEIEKQRYETVSTLEKETDEITRSKKIMQMIELDFSFNLEQHGSNKKLFILANKIKLVLEAEECRIQNTLSEMANYSLDYMEKENIADFIASLAKIQLERSNCGIQHVCCIQNAAQLVHPKLSLIQTTQIDIHSANKTGISGIEITEDDRILLCNFLGETILKYKKDGILIKERCVEGRPYQICLIPIKSQIAVTIPYKNTIVFLDSDSLKKTHQIQTEEKYHALQNLDDTLIAGGYGVLDFISVDGTVNRTISVPGDDLVRYIIKGPNNTLLYTNSFHLFSIKLIDGTKVFEYSESTEARGIAIDKNGYIYIADKNQKNIQRISRDGSLVDTIMENTGNCGPPISLRFNRDCTRLYVGLEGDKFVATFLCK